MRRFVMFLFIALTLYLVVRVGQVGWSIYQAKQWSQSLWHQVEHGPGAVADLGEIGPSKWDRVYIFHPYTSTETIHQTLGYRWPDAKWTTIESNDGVNLLVFVRSSETVGWFEHPRNRGDFIDVENTAGYSRNDARFVVASDAGWLILVTP